MGPATTTPAHHKPVDVKVDSSIHPDPDQKGIHMTTLCEVHPLPAMLSGDDPEYVSR